MNLLPTIREGGTRPPDASRARPEATLHLVALLFGLLLLAGCQTAAPDPMNEPLVARFFLEARPGEAGVPLQLPLSRVGITVNPKPVFVETDIEDAALVRVKLGWCMMVRFTPAAARDLHRLTAGGLGRRLVLTFNDQPAGAWRIEQVLGEGVLLIFVEVEDVNLPPLVERLKRTSADLAKKQK